MNCAYGFIGGGNMAAAILGGLLVKGVCRPEEIVVSDVSKDRLAFLQDHFGIHITQSNLEVVKSGRTLVLAVKPQVFSEVAAEIGSRLAPEQTVVSILAGVTVSVLREKLGGHNRIVRTMPNLPATIGRGVAGVADDSGAPEESVVVTERLLGTVGETVRVAEELLDAVTAVSGSGPGYVFRFAESLVRGGVAVGLTEEQADRLVRATLLGAAAMLAESQESPGELCRKVCSPGGTTLAGLEAMTRNGFETAIADGVRAARDRSRELSRG